MDTSRFFSKCLFGASHFATRSVGAHAPWTSRQIHLQYYSSRALPKIAQSSTWTLFVPKYLRNRSRDVKVQASKSKEWNPASFFIIIFILIGSQAIRMIALKNDYAAYTRTTDAKIELLREVIEKIRRGEDVNVEKLLGTGDETKEREWEEVLREIEAEDSLWHRKTTGPESDQESSKLGNSVKTKSATSSVGNTKHEPQKTNHPRTANFF